MIRTNGNGDESGTSSACPSPASVAACLGIQIGIDVSDVADARLRVLDAQSTFGTGRDQRMQLAERTGSGTSLSRWLKELSVPVASSQPAISGRHLRSATEAEATMATNRARALRDLRAALLGSPVWGARDPRVVRPLLESA